MNIKYNEHHHTKYLVLINKTFSSIDFFSNIQASDAINSQAELVAP